MAGIPLLLVLFPGGRPPSRRRRPVAWFASAAALIAVCADQKDPFTGN